MTGTPEGSTESGYMEKLGIEPATAGLQDIDLSPTPYHLLRADNRRQCKLLYLFIMSKIFQNKVGTEI